MISLILASALLATPVQEAQAVAKCQAWLEGREFNGPFEVRVADNALCLSGTVAAGHAEIFLTALQGMPENAPLILVARSGGGDADVTLAMAEALHERAVTVIAYDICASSCANYLFTAGHRKVVWQDAVLAYHGGATWDLLESIVSATTEQLTAIAGAQPEMADKLDGLILKNVEDNRNYLGRLIARQDAFLGKATVSPTLFRWMALYVHMTPQEQAYYCQAQSHMIVYAPAVLARFNLTIDHYAGPKTQGELDAAMVAKGLPPSFCYWDQQSLF